MIDTIEELRLLIKDAAMQRPHLTSRLEKAAFLLLLRPIQHLDGEVWRVGSEDGLRFYTVRDGECECSDYVRHGSGHLCKHRIALFLHRSMADGADESAIESHRDGGGSDGQVPRGFKG